MSSVTRLLQEQKLHGFFRVELSLRQLTGIIAHDWGYRVIVAQSAEAPEDFIQ